MGWEEKLGFYGTNSLLAIKIKIDKAPATSKLFQSFTIKCNFSI